MQTELISSTIQLQQQIIKMKVLGVHLLLYSIIVFLLCSYASAARILGLFAHPGKSHFDFFRPLLMGLAATGHNVTVVSYFPNKQAVANYTDLVLTGMPVIADVIDLQNFENNVPSVEQHLLPPFKIPTFFMLHDWGLQSCEVAFESPIIKRLINTAVGQFDVIILELFNNDCMFAVAHKLQVPIVALSSCAIMPWHYQRMGSPHISSHMPMNFLPYNDEMNFISRVNNFLHFHLINLMYNMLTQRATNALIRKHIGNDIPPVEDLATKTSVFLINQHFSLTLPFPYSSSVIEVGGLQILQPRPLPAHILRLLNDSGRGVIYISWGSMIKPNTLSSLKRMALMRAIAEFPDYTVLMKWPNETLPDHPPNLHTFAWMHQRDILCHPKVKGFLTHGGLLGSSEAVFCGVPMVVTPFYGDQFLNAMAIKKRNLGVIVEFNDFTTLHLVNALRDILTPRYSKNVMLVSESYKNRPQNPLSLSIWWVEHVIETGGVPLLRSTAQDLPWVIYHSIDIYLFLISIFVLKSLLLVYILRTCHRYLNRKSIEQKEKTQ